MTDFNDQRFKKLAGILKEESEGERQRPARSTTTRKVPPHIQARWDKRKSDDLNEEEKWMKDATNPAEKGEFTEKAKAAGMGVQEYAKHVLKKAREGSWKGDDETVNQAKFAKAAKSVAKESTAQLKLSKTQLKEMVRKVVREQLQKQGGNGDRATKMMSKIIKTAGPEDFSQEFIERMGPDLEDDIRAVLAYVARRLNVELD